MSGVTCQVPHVKKERGRNIYIYLCIKNKIYINVVVELVGGGSVIYGAYTV